MTAQLLPRSASTWRHLGRQGLRWWFAELAGLMPARFVGLMAPSRADELVLDFGRDAIRLRLPTAKHGDSMVLPLAETGERSAEWIKNGFLGSPVQISLADEFVLTTFVELPSTAEPELDKVLSHQIERLVPLDPTSISYVWRIDERLPTRKTVRVAVSIVKNATLSRAREMARRIGLHPSVIVVGSNNGATANVWAEAASETTGYWQNLLCRALEAGTILFCVAAYCVWIAKSGQQIELLQVQKMILQRDTSVSEQLSQSARSMQAKLAAVRQRLDGPTPLAILDSLTRLLPMDASIASLSYQHESLDIVGVSSHATSLLSTIAHSATFADPVFAAPITTSPGGAGEHFEMTVRIRRLHAQ